MYPTDMYPQYWVSDIWGTYQGLSSSSRDYLTRETKDQMMKLARDENITTEVIGGICKALACTPDEIMEFYDE